MYQIVLLIHVAIAVAIIVLVLLQQGKGAGMGAAFGSGASSTVFGSQGSGSFLMKVTAALAASFFVTSLALGYIAAKDWHNAQVVAIPTENSVPTTGPAIPAAPTNNDTMVIPPAPAGADNEQ